MKGDDDCDKDTGSVFLELVTGIFSNTACRTGRNTTQQGGEDGGREQGWPCTVCFRFFIPGTSCLSLFDPVAGPVTHTLTAMTQRHVGQMMINERLIAF